MNEQGDASSITQVKSVPESMQVTFQEPLESECMYCVCLYIVINNAMYVYSNRSMPHDALC